MSLDNTLPNKYHGKFLPDKWAYKLEELISYAEHNLSEQQPPQGLWRDDEQEIERLYEELGMVTFHSEYREYTPSMDKPHYHNAYAICIELDQKGYDVNQYLDKLIDLYQPWKALYELNKQQAEDKNDI